MNTFVTGWGITKFGELWDQDLRSLAVKAGIEAIKSSGIDPEKIDAIYVANMNSSLFTNQEHLGALIASELQIFKPAFRVEGACASGSLAINAGFNAIVSGLYKNVLVIGVEKMTDLDAIQATQALSAAADEEWEGFYGVTFPSLYAMMARFHMRRFKTKREDLALISVKNHKNAMLNPIAQFQKQISVEDVLNATMVSDPLGLLDCSPLSDGAAAVMLSSEKINDHSVELVASEIGTGTIALHDRADIASIYSAKIASKEVYRKLNITPKLIDIAEVHDCFSIAELVAYEDLGFSLQGKAVNDLRNGRFNKDGELPVNVSGGLKACGHPVGATGIKQAIEICMQLSGTAGARQVKKRLHRGLTHNVGGSGATTVINLFSN